MDKNAKIFCRGSEELKEIIKELEKKNIICQTVLDHADSNGFFVPKENYFEYYHKVFEEGLRRQGYTEVDPQEIKKYYESLLKPLCIIGGGCLPEIIRQFSKEYDFLKVAEGNEDFPYFFIKDASGKWKFLICTGTNINYRLTESTKEFIDYWKNILPKRENIQPKKETIKRYIGFRSGPEVSLGKLPSNLIIIDPTRLHTKGFIFYHKRTVDENGKVYHRLYWCNEQDLISEVIDIISFDDFRGRVSRQIMVDALPSPSIISKELLDSTIFSKPLKQPIILEETIQSSLKLSEKKSFEIVL